MSDDIAFKIQLGLVLPKLEEQLSEPLTSIIEEVMMHLKKGTLGTDEAPSLEAVKELLMQNLGLFLDNTILPAIDAKLNPPEDVVEESAEPEAAETEEAAG